MGMQGEASESTLARALGGMRRGPGQPRALPGQFVRELGGFAKRTIYDDELGGLPPGARTPDFNPYANETREVEDPRYRHVTGDIYFDERENPQARARVQEEEQFTALAQALEGLRGGQGSQGEALARALQAGVPASVLDDLIAEDEQLPITEQDLVQAGVAPEDARVAIATGDQAMIRRLMSDANRPEPRQPLGPYGGRSREQYLADLQETERIRAQFRSSRTRETGDPAYEERRDAILGTLRKDPVTREEQAAVDLLAQGRSVDDVLESMRRHNFPPEEIEAMERYLMPIRFRVGND